MSKLHDTYPPEPTHEPVHSAKVTVTFNLSLDVTPQAAEEVERLVKSYMQGQLNEDIQDGFTNWCANIECAEDKDLDFALDHDQLKIVVSVPPDLTKEQAAIKQAARQRREAQRAMIRALLAEHRAKMAPPTTTTKLTLLPTPPTSGRKHYTTIEERKEAQRARRRELRAAKRNNPSS
jgi:hypothetical protein